MLLKIEVSGDVYWSSNVGPWRPGLPDGNAAIDYERFDFCGGAITAVIRSNSPGERFRRTIRRFSRLPNTDPQRERELRVECRLALAALLLEDAATFILIDRPDTRVLLSSGEAVPTRLYLTAHHGSVLISDRLSELVARLDRVRFDPNALWLSMRRGFVPSPSTVYRGIYRLPSRMLFDYVVDGNESRMKNAIEQTFFEFMNEKLNAYARSADTFSDVSEGEAKEAFWSYLVNAIRQASRDDGRAGIFLSGGADSLTMFEAALQSGVYPDRLIALHYDWTGDGSGNDVRATKDICKKYGVPLRLVSVTDPVLPDQARDIVAEMHEPVGDLGYIPSYKLFAECSNELDVILTGDGADVFVQYLKSFRILNSITNSTFFAVRKRLDEFSLNQQLLKRISEYRYFSKLPRPWTILLNPVQRYHDGYFGDLIVPSTASRFVEAGCLLPFSRWFLSTEFGNLKYAMLIYCFFIEFPDFYSRKIYELAAVRGKTAFDLMRHERPFMAISPMFSKFSQGGSGREEQNKRIQRELINQCGDAKYIVNRKAALTLNPQDVAKITRRLAPEGYVQHMLEEHGVLPQASRRRQSLYNTLNMKQKFTAAVVASWTMTHRGESPESAG